MFFLNLRLLLAALAGSLGRFYCSTWHIKVLNHGAQAAYELVRYQQYVICWYAVEFGSHRLQVIFSFHRQPFFNFQHEEMWPFAGDNLTTSLHVEDSGCKIRPIGSMKFLGTNETPSFHAQAMISRRWLADGRAEKCGSKFVATFTWILINLGPLLSTSILQSSISQFCLSMWCWGGA